MRAHGRCTISGVPAGGRAVWNGAACEVLGGPGGYTAAAAPTTVPACRDRPLKPQCCPGTDARRITRHVYEFAREIARELAKTRAYKLSRRVPKKVEMLFAHLKRILQLSRLRLRGPAGAQFEFTFAAIAQNPRRLAKLTARGPPDAAASVALVA